MKNQDLLQQSFRVHVLSKKRVVFVAPAGVSCCSAAGHDAVGIVISLFTAPAG